MDISRLKEFCYLADTLSFAKTASHFYLSQSVLSKHVSSMEEELGCKLFIRDSHHVRLSEQGRAFKADAHGIIASYDQALLHIRAAGNDFAATVTIGYLRNAARPFLADFLTLMNKEHPEIRVALRCFEYGDMFYSLSIGAVDMAVSIEIAPFEMSGCDFWEIYADRFEAIMAFDHPLAQNPSVTSKQLASCKLLLPDREIYGNMRGFVEGLVPAPCDERLCGTYRDIDTLYLKVKTEKYVGFSCEHNRALFGDDVSFLPLADRNAACAIGAFVLQKEPSRAVETCLQSLEKCGERLRRDLDARAAAGSPRF